MRTGGGIGGELCDGFWTESKIEGSAISRCYSGKPLGYPPGPQNGAEKTRRGKREKKGGCNFSELERKFAQLNGTRCLPLIPLIVVESTTRVESRNKGNTSRAFLHHPTSVPSPEVYSLRSLCGFELESISSRSRHLFSLSRSYW